MLNFRVFEHVSEWGYAEKRVTIYTKNATLLEVVFDQITNGMGEVTGWSRKPRMKLWIRNLKTTDSQLFALSLIQKPFDYYTSVEDVIDRCLAWGIKDMEN